MKHKRFEENILVDEAYTNYGKTDKNADTKKGDGFAKHFAESIEYEERKKWYHQIPQEPSTISSVLNDSSIEELKKEANSALHGDTMAYETKTNRSGSSDQQWARTLLNKGAIGDRVAAATILIQDNPIHNLTALRNLVNSVKPAKKKDGIVVIDALSELFVSELLMPDIKLRTFEQHPLGHLDEMSSGNKQTRRNILKLWYYEDQVKELYGSYVEALNKFAHDSVEANKEKAVSAMSYLLMHHPEREKMLLTNIINKLGDPSQTVASKVIYHLCQILYNHPNMKSVVLTEIEKMLFRSNISSRAQYYGICFLNQFFLGKDDAKIAENLIRIYFSFFKASIKKGEIDSRLMSAILTGVKRAYPFADKDRISETPAHIDAIHKLVHLTKMNIAIHALALLAQISDASKSTSDRFYTALYRKLTNADIFNTTHSALLFSLIYKSLKRDKNTDRVAAFVKRLLQLSCYMSPAQSCGMLFLVSQVLKDGEKKAAVKLNWTKIESTEEQTEYNPMARNPSFAGANHSAYLELCPLSMHFHPTVKLFAEKILNEQVIQYSGDPLKDFAGIRFLDRFVFKNPKKREEEQDEGSVKKVRGSHPKFAVRKNYVAKGLRSLPVNSSTYLNEDVKKIPVDERFLYDFLQKRREAKDSDDDDSDKDSITSEDFESYLDSMTGKPEDDSDQELDFLSELEASKQKKATKRKKGDDEQLDQLDDDEDDTADGEAGDDDSDSDGELDLSGDDEEPAFSGDEEEMLLQESDDDGDQIDVPGTAKKRRMDLKLKGKDDLSSLFASAEEFSTLLEQTASNKAQGSSQAVSNADNSSRKQLAWEDKRNNWIKDYSKKIHGNKKGGKKFHKTQNGGVNKFHKTQNGGVNKMSSRKKVEKRKGGKSSKTKK